jgi:large subunit ribosomal protein L13
MKTKSIKKSEIHHDWWLADATGKILGRFASEIAQILRGKHKANFTPNMNMGDHVIVVNAEKIRISGKKEENKEYFHHTGYPGGTVFTSYKQMKQTHPERIIEKAVKGMLPHNRLGRDIAKNLKVYTGPDHPHSAQTPKILEFK